MSVAASVLAAIESAVHSAATLFAAEHPDQTTGPSAYGLAVAISKGADPQRAADQAWFFYQNAVDPDGAVYGSAYTAEVRNHGGAGAESGYGYGMSAAEFAAQFQQKAKPADPGFRPKDCGAGWAPDASGRCAPIKDYWNVVGSLLSR